MTYHIPVLRLVGAASNLVLDASGTTKQQGPGTDCVSNPAIDEVAADPDDDAYSLRANW
jgi:hypothetical protein